MSVCKFSSIHGPNVSLDADKSTSSWKINKFYGTCVSDRNFLDGDDVELHLAGRGHVFVGITPTNLHDYVQDGTDCRSYCTLFYKQFKLKNNSVGLSWRFDHDGHHKLNVTYSTADGEEKVLHIHEDVWLYIQMAFGDITAEIKTQGTPGKKPPLRFDTLCGKNVRLCENRLTASLKVKNPGALCSIEKPLNPGETIQVSVAPAKTPTWTELVTYVSNTSPEDVDDNGEIKSPETFNLFSVEKSYNARGLVTLDMTSEGHINYVILGCNKSMDLNNHLDLTEPVFVYFEPLRVKLTLVPTCLQEESDDYTEECLEQCSDNPLCGDYSLMSRDDSDSDSESAQRSNKSCLPVHADHTTTQDEDSEATWHQPFNSIAERTQTSITQHDPATDCTDVVTRSLQENVVTSHCQRGDLTEDVKVFAEKKQMNKNHGHLLAETMTTQNRFAEEKVCVNIDTAKNLQTMSQHIEHQQQTTKLTPETMTQHIEHQQQTIKHTHETMSQHIEHQHQTIKYQQQTIKHTPECILQPSLEQFPDACASSRPEQNLPNVSVPDPLLEQFRTVSSSIKHHGQSPVVLSHHQPQSLNVPAATEQCLHSDAACLSTRTLNQSSGVGSPTRGQEHFPAGSPPVTALEEPTASCEPASRKEQLPDVCAFTHQGMFEQHIRPFYTEFVNNMEPEAVADYLFQFKVISDDQLEEVQVEHIPRKKKNRILLNAVKNMPVSDTLSLFKLALNESKHQRLADLIHI